MSDSSKTDPVPAAMASPAIGPIPRRPNSIRRTSSIDMHLGPDGLTLHGNARDLVTHDDSTTTVTSEATVTASVDPAGVLARLVADPDRGDATRLVGRGFPLAVDSLDSICFGAPAISLSLALVRGWVGHVSVVCHVSLLEADR